jgi:hypothetical protein
MADNSKLKIAAAVSGSFTALVIGVFVLMVKHVVTFQMGLLMVVALIGLYFGFGVLVLVYRFTSRLK